LGSESGETFWEPGVRRRTGRRRWRTPRRRRRRGCRTSSWSVWVVEGEESRWEFRENVECRKIEKMLKFGYFWRGFDGIYIGKVSEMFVVVIIIFISIYNF